MAAQYREIESGNYNISFIGLGVSDEGLMSAVEACPNFDELMASVDNSTKSVNETAAAIDNGTDTVKEATVAIENGDVHRGLDLILPAAVAAISVLFF